MGVREASLVLGVSPDERSIGAARRRVSAFLALSDLDAEDAECLVLVTSELCTNAVKATDPAARAEVVVGCRLAGGAVEVEVSNRGEGFRPGRPQMPPPDATSGRGLSLVDILTDRLVVRQRNGRTTVRAVRRLSGPASAA